MKNNELKILILNRLTSFNVGRENAITQRELSFELKVSDEAIRGAINSLRQDNIPICSGRCGIWYAKNDEEVLETIENLNNRIIGINNAVNGMVDYLHRKIN